MTRGGRAPFDDVRIVVRPDRFEGTGRRIRELRYHLAPRALTRLKRQLERIELTDVPTSSVPLPTDGYVYEVTANDRTIRAPQGKLPPLLAPVIALAGGQGRAPRASG